MASIIEVGRSKKLKLLVLSDLHLADPDEADKGSAYGLDTAGRLSSAIERINRFHSDADLAVFAGDLADLGRSSAYETLAETLATLPIPYVLTLGNHDNREAFAAKFGADHLSPDGFAHHAIDLEGHRIIVLDTLERGPSPGGFWGQAAGRLCPVRLDWCKARLSEARDRPVIVVSHHPPVAFGVHMDRFAFENAETLEDLLVTHGNVRLVISGHIHRSALVVRNGITFATISGGHTTSREPFGSANPYFGERYEGPAGLAVIVSDASQTTVHFDAYVDANRRMS
jgi:3',5'-cyclic-AMP phosphodiesterase